MSLRFRVLKHRANGPSKAPCLGRTDWVSMKNLHNLHDLLLSMEPWTYTTVGLMATPLKSLSYVTTDTFLDG
jgi:hypothetical protein